MAYGKPSAHTSRSFLLLRLHSLAGIVPLGLFLLEHYYSNAVAMLGKHAYNLQIEKLQAIPFLPLLEIVLIAIPLLYHAGYGIYIAAAARNNVSRYAYRRNWMFLLQRLSGIITLIFILYHLWAFRLANLFFGTPVNFDTVQEHLSNPLIVAFYVLGVVSTTFHFTNGLATGLITWGVTINGKSQRAASNLLLGMFVLLSGIGISTLMAF
jgi:succinate dehydrogenase / fumarate reductase cytochrome b subunit